MKAYPLPLLRKNCNKS